MFFCNRIWIAVSLILLLLFGETGGNISKKPVETLVSIRGNQKNQAIPFSLTYNWAVYTVDFSTKSLLQQVEIPGSSYDDTTGIQETWVNPTSYTNLFLPSDLPLPDASLCLGVALSNGSPRYIFPSLSLSLETPSRLWRNRGINSLPRSKVWLDVFSPYCPSLSSLKLSSYSKLANDVRFLEDQDGNAAWQNSIINSNFKPSMLRPDDEDLTIDINDAFTEFKKMLAIPSYYSKLSQSFCFVDIVIPNTKPIKLSTTQMKLFLTDFESPKRLLEIQNEDLENEALGMLDVKVDIVGAGRDSKYMPVAYQELYGEGNIIMK